MRVAIRYFTRSGNTEKLVSAMSEELGITALSVDQPLMEPVDLLILGSSVYAGGVDPAVRAFLQENHLLIGKIVNVSTAAIATSTYRQVAKIAAEYGISMSPLEFHCRGAFSVLHKGHPNANDLSAAKAFARSVV